MTTTFSDSNGNLPANDSTHLAKAISPDAPDEQTLSAFLATPNTCLVHSVDELRNVDGTIYTSAFRSGFFSDGDGGHGFYRQDPADTTTVDDGGFCVVATDGKRWKILHDGILSLSVFGALGQGSISAADMLTYLELAWNSAVTRGHDLYASPGTRDTGLKYMPWRQETVDQLLDCRNVTLIGAGPNSIFSTTSIEGADVFQLNGLKNFHIKNLAITASVSGSVSGSNGISITSGFDNISIENVHVFNVPALDKGDHLDGGKALTVQSDMATNEVGTLTIRGLYAKGCAQGFGFDANLANMLDKKVAIDVDLVAEDCYTAVIYSAAAAASPIPAGAGTGIRVRGHSINCQIDAWISRAHGIDVDLTVVSTKTATERTLNPTGSMWLPSNPVVQALLCNYAKDSRISMTGNKGDCAYKAQIGSASAAPGGQGPTPTTDNCTFYLDIGGTSSVSDLNDVGTGGATMTTSNLYVSIPTASVFPASFYLSSSANILTRGPTMRLVDPLVSGALRFAMSPSGNVETGRVDLFNGITGLQGGATSATDAPVAALVDSYGVPRLGVINGNGIAIDNISTFSPQGEYVGKIRLVSMTGTLLGYISVNK